ncbi:type II toxin-antitoxin system antitoxin SocA domain-containing protein [Chryseobacterium sp. WX]|uniref:Panacea domain-containing protein n=1 Tax=Chryseobacterium sp. WX TaxID=3031803 RepID=UPI00240A93B9|nr:type II toxin-antitoxin system antitoxin SocA domain-containing protein [Chryseobacterium sp. WX]WFB67016.1 DUF4065 domain-containing protein [Chryseobacterium sp. WX]
MYNCFDVAKQFLKLAKEDGEVLEPMKLLKLTYIAHGWYLGFYDKPLIKNSVQAWKYGPVIPELYHVTKRFGHGNVDIEIVDLYSENKLSNQDKTFLKTIWNAYKGFTGLQLSTKTHMDNTPWKEAYDPKVYHKVITNELIKEHYKKLIDERR